MEDKAPYCRPCHFPSLRGLGQVPRFPVLQNETKTAYSSLGCHGDGMGDQAEASGPH